MTLTERLLEVANIGAEWVLWLLLLLSVVSVAVMVDRWRFYRQRRIDVDDLTDNHLRGQSRRACEPREEHADD